MIVIGIKQILCKQKVNRGLLHLHAKCITHVEVSLHECILGVMAEEIVGSEVYNITDDTTC